MNTTTDAEVKVYSTDWCPYCHALMDWLDTLGVKYTELNAEDYDFQSIPVTEIGDKQITGFDRPAILKELKAAGIGTN